jgi:hypothetical protein
MSLKRKGSWLAAWVLFLLVGGPALAEDAREVQLFAPADPASYGGGPRPNEGFFFVYEGLYWTIKAPDTATFGKTPTPATARVVYWGPSDLDTTTQTSSFDTSFLKADWTGGQRIEFGSIYEHSGWLISYMELTRQSQFSTRSNVQVYYDDDKWGHNTEYSHLQGHTDTDLVSTTNIQNLGVEYDSVTLRNFTKFWGVEAAYLFRMHPFDGGTYAEIIGGPRYVEFNDQFDIEAQGGLLADTNLVTKADNRMVGGEIGLRLNHTCDRWTFSALGLFAGLANMQTVRSTGIIGTQLNPPGGTMEPLAMGPLDVNHIFHKTEFSPLIEMRVEAKYQITRAITVKAGWNGIWLDHVARASNMIDYHLYETSALGLLGENNKQNVFMNGLVVGLEVNR